MPVAAQVVEHQSGTPKRPFGRTIRWKRRPGGGAMCGPCEAVGHENRIACRNGGKGEGACQFPPLNRIAGGWSANGKLKSADEPCPPTFPFVRDPRGIWLPTLDAFRTLAA